MQLEVARRKERGQELKTT